MQLLISIYITFEFCNTCKFEKNYFMPRRTSMMAHKAITIAIVVISSWNTGALSKMLRTIPSKPECSS